MGGASRNWFRPERSDRAIEDFFDLCEANFDANEASARELERHRGVTDTTIGEQVANARVRFRQARAGDWEPFEQHLRQLGGRFAREGLALETWTEISHQFYRALVPRFVAALSAEPQRLTDLLLVLGDYMERSVALIASEYHVVAQDVDRELEEDHGEVLAASADAVIVMDERGSIIDLNAAAVTTFGYARTAAIGRELAELIIPERLRAAHRAGLARVITTGESRVIGRRVELVALSAVTANVGSPDSRAI